MKNKKIPIIITMVLGVALIIYGALSFERPKPVDKVVTESQKVQKAFDQIIADFIKKDVTGEEMNSKYSVDYLDDGYMPFAKGNMLSYKPQLTSPTEEQNTCLKQVDANYDKVIKTYKDNLDYELTIDEEKDEMTIKIKTYKLRLYHIALTKVTDLFVAADTNIGELNEEKHFAKKCLAMSAMSNHLNEFENKDKSSNITVKYVLSDGNLRLDTYDELGRVLSGLNELVDNEKANQEATQISNKIFDAEK